MKKYTLVLIAMAFLTWNAHAQLFVTPAAKIDFFSKTPVEDIEAHSDNGVAILNTKTGELAFQVINTSFHFPNKLMEEHFNEKYMESEKFPKSSFKGKINETIDYTKDGTHNVTVTGTLNIHGVEQARTITGKVIIANGTIQLISDFKVKVADHKIEIPKLVLAKIAEEINVTVNATLAPKK
jgi:hypothetical protein